MESARITKTSGDYRHRTTGRICTGDFWKVQIANEAGDVVGTINYPASWARSRVEEVVRANIGFEATIS